MTYSVTLTLDDTVRATARFTDVRTANAFADKMRRRLARAEWYNPGSVSPRTDYVTIQEVAQ